MRTTARRRGGRRRGSRCSTWRCRSSGSTGWTTGCGRCGRRSAGAPRSRVAGGVVGRQGGRLPTSRCTACRAARAGRRRTVGAGADRRAGGGGGAGRGAGCRLAAVQLVGQPEQGGAEPFDPALTGGPAAPRLEGDLPRGIQIGQELTFEGGGELRALDLHV